MSKKTDSVQAVESDRLAGESADGRAMLTMVLLSLGVLPFLALVSYLPELSLIGWSWTKAGASAVFVSGVWLLFAAGYVWNGMAPASA